MAGLISLFQPEIAAALARWYNLPSPPTPQVFGIGLRHAFDLGDGSYFSDPEVERATVARWGRESIDAAFEEGLIMGPPERLPSGPIRRPDDTWGFRQLEGELAIRDRITAQGHTPDLARRVVMAEEASHAIHHINLLAIERGLPPLKLESREQIEDLVFSMPSKGVLTRMRMSAHENEAFKWEVGDLGDLTSLAVAAAYCDIVVTERKWGAILRRHESKLRAKILTKLEDLPIALLQD